MKVCKICGQVKGVSEFYVNRSNKDGLLGHCKVCARNRIRPKRGRRQVQEIQAGIASYLRVNCGIQRRQSEWVRKQIDEIIKLLNNDEKN